MSFALGLEVCLAAPPPALTGKRFGLLVNQASVDGRFRYAHELWHERFPGQLAALFSPQHGLFSEQQDNMVETPNGRDPRNNVPVHSLYADTRRPTRAMLDGFDLLIIDLQDVGTRVYTYIWTLTNCLEACAQFGIPVLVLDRPNPLGGVVIEGPMLTAGFESFVGRASIPMRHGLTIGELALYLNESMHLGATVEVVKMSGWERRMMWPDLGRSWVPTSPNLPRFEGVLAYPGQVLVEGTRLSEGRGTTTPFEVVGAPYVDPERLARRVVEFGCEGAVLRPIRFEPTFHKHAGQSCGGVYIHPIDSETFRPYRLGLAVLGAVRELWPGDFEWLPPPYEYETEKMPIDILSGSDRARRGVDAGLTTSALDELCAVDAERWKQQTSTSRLYK